MPIRVLSLDFDGCLFNDNYYRVFDNDVILANLSFLSELRKERDIYTKTYTYIGSNRQSRALDVHNNNENGSESCFFAIQKINKYLTSVFVPLLTADIINDLISGHSFERIISGHYGGPHGTSFFDKSKLIILYSQMHDIAKKHPTDNIVFDFFDDRGNGSLQTEDILENLSNYFTNYPEMIPNNVLLRLHHYQGDNVTTLFAKTGRGKIDADYRQTVINMLEVSLGCNPKQLLTDYITPKLLSKVEAQIPAPRQLVVKTIKTEQLMQAISNRNGNERHVNFNPMYRSGDLVPRSSIIETKIPLFKTKTCCEQVSEQIYDGISSCFAGSHALRIFSVFKAALEPGQDATQEITPRKQA